MHRYISSSIISTLIYTFAGALIFYFFSVHKYSAENIKILKIEKVCLSTITQKSEPMIEKEKIKEVEPEPKEIKEKPKPIKKEPIAKNTPKPDTKPVPNLEPIVEPTQKSAEYETKEIVTEQQNSVSPSTNNVPDIDMSEAKRELFIANLIQRINSNKSYPNSARRRSIEGSVEVEFTVLADGNVKNIEVISGQNIFAESTIEAIKNSFPVKIDDGLFAFPKKFKIDILYILK